MRMNTTIQMVRQGDTAWPPVAAVFPRAVRWMRDAKDGGNYHLFAATGDAGRFLGCSVIEIGNMRFGPLAETKIGFLEDIHVTESERRKGVGSALLRATLDHAWAQGCENVRWAVQYENEAAVALYRSMGLGFVPDEDPDAEEPQRQYTVVAINPARVETGYGCQHPPAN
jgi:ribosomal protein S18 acetylase RimI-like enzyme